MPLKNNDKNKDIEMEKMISTILVVNNSNLKPYIEIFDYYPENITQQPLGILTGFFEIRDYSEDSAYVVNFLNSVARKEYYLNPKRSVPESFDNSLHKINIALSELAKHGNVNWLGKIDSALCAFEKNSLHFTVTGNAKILLWRKNSLTDITEGLSIENPEPHPLKTFTNVSSGRLEKNDKIIITSTDIFNILSLSDIQKNLTRFNNDEKFSRFMKTAISNELDLAGIIIVDIRESEKTIPKKHSETEEEKAEPVNVFSGSSFNKKKGKATLMIKKSAKKASSSDQESTDEDKKEYTDKKTGHIYIQGEDEDKEESGLFSEQAQIAKESLQDLLYSLKAFFSNHFLIFWKKCKTILLLLRNYDYVSKMSSLREKFKKEKLPNEIKGSKEAQEKSISEKKLLEEFSPDEELQVENKLSISEEGNFSLKENFYSLLFKIKLWFKKTKVQFYSKKNASSIGNLPKKESLLTPNFKKIKDLFLKLNLTQKISTFLIIILIVVGPIIFSNIKSKEEVPSSISSLDVVEVPEEQKLDQEKNISFINQLEKIASIENGIGIFYLQQGLYAVTKEKIVLQNSQVAKEFSLPEEHGKGKSSAYMDDLGLILILTDKNKVLSFSPISQDFKDNSISFPEGSNIDLIATYLTYLYTLDRSNNQIYRYPRAEGGFSDKSDWLQEEINLSNVLSMAIDENLYLAEKNLIRKLFRGKITNDLTIEQSQTAINFDLIYANINTSNLYILDKANSRVVQFSKEGSLLKQYHNESLSDAISFSVDEKNNKLYIITSSETGSLLIN